MYLSKIFIYNKLEVYIYIYIYIYISFNWKIPIWKLFFIQLYISMYDKFVFFL